MAFDGLKRRQFLSGMMAATTALYVPSALAQSTTGKVPWTPSRADLPPSYPLLRFFTEQERRCVDAIVARLIPSDESGPGAREAGVVDFIDSQMAGFYGRGERWYMQGPFEEGFDGQGYQSEHPPAGLYRAALEAIDAHCRDAYGNRSFADLSEDEQDEILKRMDDGELELDGVSAQAFFDLILDNAIEGFFCDPIYGGNRDMVGWKLVGFPGARYDYRDFLDHNGARIELEPVSLKGRPGWNPA
ncbi:gluconate 2-dehydrogenase subunit 3 family protein (plasmid) [Rhizobium rosettiformans]|uniref:Gluconate 2-dehydrogenase subunit 3 family protein n=2 Tax=Rhizobium/Agrobacterium group TaxID=227290 RepID=A0ABX7F1Q3_9HYPH|nr:gluconate 2-dehydrogenase subunit 3 family protein [Rhizobium rosettiformans]